MMPLREEFGVLLTLFFVERFASSGISVPLGVIMRRTSVIRLSTSSEAPYSTIKLYVSVSSTNVRASDGDAPGYTTFRGGFACIVIVACPGLSVAKLNR